MESSPLLAHQAGAATAVNGAVDHRGLPVFRSTSGGWTSAAFIIAVEIAERFVYYGVSSNLITYLTGPLGENTAAAAANVNAWAGASSMLPLLGAFVADSWLGRYRTIVCASALYILGLAILSLSAELPSLHPQKCSEGNSCPPTKFQEGLFFFSIYLISFAQGGHKPCVQAFGADQFDENDPGECKSKSSFFNWWYFGMSAGTVVTISLLNYVQDNISWALGFEIPFVSMVLALTIFLLGSKTYRYYVKTSKSPPGRTDDGAVDEENKLTISDGTIFVNVGGTQQHLLTEQSTSVGSTIYSSIIEKSGLELGLYQKEKLKAVLKLFPIWCTCLIYAIVFAQSSTFFTKQGSTLDRKIGATFLVPPAALQSFISIAILAFIPIYDRIIIPVTRNFSGFPTGITMLQRIGTGMFLSLVSMVVAALVEIKRLRIAKEYGLIDLPKVPIPMSLWWLVPQYILFGVADVFAMVGLQEFFYDQVPVELRSLGLSLYLSIFGIGSFISSFLVSVIDKYSSRNGRDSWFSRNLNRGHLDYFYWLLSGLSAIQLLVYVHISNAYQYKRK